jgi:hypothetical protein
LGEVDGGGVREDVLLVEFKDGVNAEVARENAETDGNIGF